MCGPMSEQTTLMSKPLFAIEQEQLEAIIDSHTLSDVLAALGNICDEKANHITENWQDRQTARPWIKAGSKLKELASDLGI